MAITASIGLATAWVERCTSVPPCRYRHFNRHSQDTIVSRQLPNLVLGLDDCLSSPELRDVQVLLVGMEARVNARVRPAFSSSTLCSVSGSRPKSWLFSVHFHKELDIQLLVEVR